MSFFMYPIIISFKDGNEISLSSSGFSIINAGLLLYVLKYFFIFFIEPCGNFFAFLLILISSFFNTSLNLFSVILYFSIQ